MVVQSRNAISILWCSGSNQMWGSYVLSSALAML